MLVAVDDVRLLAPVRLDDTALVINWPPLNVQSTMAGMLPVHVAPHVQHAGEPSGAVSTADWV